MNLNDVLKRLGASSTYIASYDNGWTGTQHRYVHSLPIGKIGQPIDEEGAISANEAREIINKEFSSFGPIVHLALAPHKPLHNAIEVLESAPTENTVVVADGVICPVQMRPTSLMFATMVGDCATIMVIGKKNLAFMHVGSQEIFDGLLDVFAEKWDNEEIEMISIGPSIRGSNYELPIEKVPKSMQRFMVDIDLVTEKKGFDCLSAIVDAFEKMGVQTNKIEISPIDPYYECQNNPDPEWASHRFYSQQDEYSPRDLATVFVSVGPKWEDRGHDQ